MKAAILTVGTEITSGEILNRNSAWLALQLEGQAVSVPLHLSTPDDRPLIKEFLKQALLFCDFVFVTGGLGPTTDDFTREVVADFLGRPLVFDETIWAKLTQFYESRGLPLRPSHRQQCFFPEGSEILANPVGTAQGFLCRSGEKSVFVLPGPPAEVEGVFSTSVLPRLRALQLKKSLELTVYKCLGAPESEVAEIVEACLHRRGFQLGYRASHPYVLVKVWHPPEVVDWQDELLEKLKPWYVGGPEFDFAKEWVASIQGLPHVRVVDEATGGLLASRLETIHRAMAYDGCELELISYWGLSVEYARATYREPVDAQFSVHANGESDSFRVTADLGGEAFSRSLKLSYRLQSRSERGRRFMAEEALRLWSQFVKARRK
jgi:molybdenum cofactor synthesis domain-containing protein